MAATSFQGSNVFWAISDKGDQIESDRAIECGAQTDRVSGESTCVVLLLKQFDRP